MAQTGAVIFLPREDGQISRMLEDLLFDPAALWLSQALESAGVERFFVVCHGEDRSKAQTCFPDGTKFVTNDSGDAVEQLTGFLQELEGKALVITRPVVLSWEGARTLAEGGDTGLAGSQECGIFRAEGASLAQALSEGAGLEEALRDKADKIGGRSNWYQSYGPFRSGTQGRMEAEQMARQFGAERLLDQGVRLMDASSCYVGPRVQVGSGTVLLPGTILRGETFIGKGCEIGPYSMIRDCVIGDKVTVNQSQLNESTVETEAKIGPFAYIRPDCHVGAGVKVGDFVELKNSIIGAGTKISHLTYVGDSDVGQKVNFGCGTVTVNYDGSTKFRTTIGDNAFIGCNTNLVAPVKVGDGAYTAAGSTITNDVPPDSLAIARSMQMVKKQWAAKRRKGRR